MSDLDLDSLVKEKKIVIFPPILLKILDEVLLCNRYSTTTVKNQATRDE